jgi:hypothetical protein
VYQFSQKGCWENENFFVDIPGNIIVTEKSVLDPDGLLHGPAKKSGSIRQDGSICWLAVRGLMVDKMDWYQVLDGSRKTY